MPWNYRESDWHWNVDMSKRRPKKPPKTDAADRLRKALAKRTKGELVDVLVELAREDRNLLRRLDARFELEAPPKELVAATRQAIADATDFDERDINRNFDYDYEAYDEVKRNLGRLIDLGQLRLAMELSLELMKEGSYQVEMSDEGLMTDDIEECLSVVVKALKKCDLPPGEVIAWCEADDQERPRGIHLRSGTSGAAKPLRGIAAVVSRRRSRDVKGVGPRTAGQLSPRDRRPTLDGGLACRQHPPSFPSHAPRSPGKHLLHACRKDTCFSLCSEISLSNPVTEVRAISMLLCSTMPNAFWVLQKAVSGRRRVVVGAKPVIGMGNKINLDFGMCSTYKSARFFEVTITENPVPAMLPLAAVSMPTAPPAATRSPKPAPPGEPAMIVGAPLHHPLTSSASRSSRETPNSRPYKAP